MIVSEHKSRDGKLIVSVCDSGLIGKKFEQGNKILDLTSKFYQGEEKSEEDILKLFRKAYIVNLVGEKSVNLGMKAEIVSGNHVIVIKKIPHAQAVLQWE